MILKSVFKAFRPSQYDLFVSQNHIQKGGETLAKETLVHVDPERIDRLLKERGKNKSKMATDLLLSREHLYRQLKKEVLSVDWLKKISEYLDVNEGYLTGESDRIAHPSRIKAVLKQFLDKHPNTMHCGVRRELYLKCMEQLGYDQAVIQKIYETLNTKDSYDRLHFMIDDSLDHIDNYVKMKFNQLVERIEKEVNNNGTDNQDG